MVKNKLSCLIERFLLQLIVLEMLCAVIRAPIHWDMTRIFTRTHASLPEIVVIQQLPRSGWYLIGDCHNEPAQDGILQIHSRDGICLEGPFSQLYRLRTQAMKMKPLKYGFRPLYIY